MTPIESKPSRNEEEYFARENADRIKALRARLDKERDEAQRATHLGRCPRCGGELSEQTHHQMRIDVCGDCGGTWLDKGELEMLGQVDAGKRGSFVNELFGLRG